MIPRKGDDVVMKYAIFVVGERKSGKSTILRSLTGLWAMKRGQVWRVRSLDGRPLWAFVIHSSPQELGMSRYPPNDFPEAFERKYDVSRDAYDLLISALELSVRDPQYSYREYISNVRRQGFDVRIATINTRWDETPEDALKIRDVQNFTRQHGIPITLIDASEDPNVAANRVRSALYP